MEFVLTESHRLFKESKNDEQYCYIKGKIQLNQINNIKWKNKKIKLYTDKHGENDLGNIDVFVFQNQSYYLEGDWGILELNARELIVRLT